MFKGIRFKIDSDCMEHMCDDSQFLKTLYYFYPLGWGWVERLAKWQSSYKN